MLCIFTKSNLKGLCIYAHSCFIEMAGIAFVEVMRFDRYKAIRALHLPRQCLERSVVCERHAHWLPTIGGVVVLRCMQLLQFQVQCMPRAAATFAHAPMVSEGSPFSMRFNVKRERETPAASA
jgi:hypothetical protein